MTFLRSGPAPVVSSGPRKAWGRGILVGALSLLMAAAPLRGEAAEILHVVGKGQTLGRIAKRYHVTVETLREVNNIRPGQRIHPGLTLVIPEKGKEAEAEKRAEKLRKGEDEGSGAKGGKAGAKGGKAGASGAEAKGGKAGATAGDKKGGKGSKKDEEERRGYARVPKRPGFVRLVRGSERFEGQLLTRQGRLAPAALSGLGRVLRFFPTDEKITIDPRLATLIGMVSDHFGGRTIHVVSGYRPYTPAQYTPHSNHNHGRAMDFTVEGVPNTAVRDFCRSFRNAGVGYYPNSTFVHLDARSGKTFWIDYSRAGEAPRYDSPNASATADEAAKDVEPHAGAADGSPPGSEPEPGSNDTQ